MWHKVTDLSPDQRAAVESLLGRRLADDEGFNIYPSRMIKEAPTGEERSRAYTQYLEDLDTLAERAQDVPDDELEAVIDEACDRARHRSS
jgi:hypothetical protein